MPLEVYVGVGDLARNVMSEDAFSGLASACPSALRSPPPHGARAHPTPRTASLSHPPVFTSRP